MPRWREVGDIDDHTDGVFGLAGRDGTARDGIATVVFEQIGGIVPGICLAEAELAGWYLHWIRPDIRRRVGHDIDAELLRTHL